MEIHSENSVELRTVYLTLSFGKLKVCIDFCPFMYKWREEKTIMGLIKRDCNTQEECGMGENTERKSLLLKMIFYRK